MIMFFSAANGIGPGETSVFNDNVMRSLTPFVILLAAASIGVNVYKWMVGHWNRIVAIVNASFHLNFAVFLIFLASRDSLFDPAFMAYLSDRFDVSTGSIEVYPFVILWIIVLSIISSDVYDTIVGFKKARIKHT